MHPSDFSRAGRHRNRMRQRGFRAVDSVTWRDNQTLQLSMSGDGNGVIPLVLHVRDDSIEVEDEGDLLRSC